MNAAERTIMRLLREHGPCGGLELVRLSEADDSVKTLRRGTVYVHLEELRAQGVIEGTFSISRFIHSGGIRYIYRIADRTD